ncbi:MAG: hypothetical protein H7842_10815 [Gammaproteobacteria bacterium SHHR-1]|uniref:hypothetical protein n=1 Tax=Magnetovirga frankeli TaxID=947516 RepID=UPI001293C614|nr:hypothetical protein D5125_00060 [gamma proteobacterium SS-5]
MPPWFHTNPLWLLLIPLLSQANPFLEPERIKAWVDEPRLERFSLCYNHSCTETAIVGLSAKQWAQVERLFRPKPKGPAAERKAIARAIGLLETLVAPLIGTQQDKALNFQGSLAQSNQLDCIDEARNSTTYLKLMQQLGLLRFHRVRDTATRGWFINGMPHTTAVIRERRSGLDYAVDSWFHDNGVAAEVLPVDEWSNGWHPPESP